MMVRRHRGVVDAALRVGVDLAGQPPGDEQVERVVHGRLGHAAVSLPQAAEDLLGRHVARRGEQLFGDLESLRGRTDSVLLQDQPGADGSLVGAGD
jgi:hypothetical protein